MKDLTKSGSNRHIPDSTKTLDVTIAAKRSFFRKKSKTILGPDAFNQTYFNRREDRNVLERCQSCESPPKRSKNIENQNRRKYFSSSKSLKLPDMPSESSAKSSLESVESAHEQSLHVAVDVHQQEPELKVASLASIDEILEFEQEMAQLEAGLVTLSTVHTLVWICSHIIQYIDDDIHSSEVNFYIIHYTSKMTIWHTLRLLLYHYYFKPFIYIYISWLWLYSVWNIHQTQADTIPMITIDKVLSLASSDVNTAGKVERQGWSWSGNNSVIKIISNSQTQIKLKISR